MTNTVFNLFTKLGTLFDQKTAIKASSLRKSIKDYLQSYCGYFVILYFDQQGCLLFQDLVTTSSDGAVKQLFTQDMDGRPTTDYTAAVKGKPLWEVIADGVHCAERTGSAHSVTLLPVRTGCVVRATKTQTLVKPAWAS